MSFHYTDLHLDKFRQYVQEQMSDSYLAERYSMFLETLFNPEEVLKDPENADFSPVREIFITSFSGAELENSNDVNTTSLIEKGEILKERASKWVYFSDEAKMMEDIFMLNLIEGHEEGFTN